MGRPRRILMLVNWQVRYSDFDLPDEQPSNKVVRGERYWFFKYWEGEDVAVDVVDFTMLKGIHTVERKVLKFYLSQALRVLPDLDNYDLIVSHSAQSAVMLALMRSMAGKKRPPHVIIDPGSFNGGRKRLVELLPIKMSLASVAGVIGHARSQIPFYRDVLCLKPERFRIVHVGVDTQFYSPVPGGEEEDYVLCLGYMKRDWNTLLEAWQGLKTDARLLILGKEEIGDGVDGVTSMGYVPRLRMKELISAARFVVIPLPYHTYSFGQISLLISQALGKAVIVTRVPGLLDYGHDGRTLLFTRPYDAEDMRDKISFLLNDAGASQELGREAKKLVRSRYSDKHMGLSLREAIYELCENV
jgi:glycosyltransferase involved in cell wall biosynthesis